MDEAQISAEAREGFLVDSVDGGTGVCENIFTKFDEFVVKSRGYSTCCASKDCVGELPLGCAQCLYRYPCEALNESLLSVLGLANLQFQEISLEKEEEKGGEKKTWLYTSPNPDLFLGKYKHEDFPDDLDSV